MGKTPELREQPELPPEIKDAGLSGNLVLFIGAGPSKLAGLPTWKELASLVLSDLREYNVLNYSDVEQLKVLDPKKQLSVAEILFQQNELSFISSLQKYLFCKPASKIYDFINKIGCVYVTTNYDELILPLYIPEQNGSATRVEPRRYSHPEEFYTVNLDTPGSIIHLHGVVSEPGTMIVTTKQYLEHYDNPKVQYFLKELFANKVILFIGYGLEESEILEHIFRRGHSRNSDVVSSDVRRRFALQGFFRSEEPLYNNLSDYYLNSFGVHLIGFMRDHMDFGQLVPIIKNWSELIEVRPPTLSADLEFMDRVLGNA